MSNWKNLLQRSRHFIGPLSYNIWFKYAEVVEESSRLIRVCLPTESIKNYVESRYTKLFKKELAAMGLADAKLIFEVKQNGDNARKFKQLNILEEQKPSAKPSAIMAAKQPSANNSLFRLNINCTFDNFLVGDPNQFAFSTVYQLARKLHLPYNPLYIYGSQGVGKTHLLSALGNSILTLHPQLRILACSAEHFVNRFYEHLDNRNMNGFRAIFRNIDLLIMDDIQVMIGKPKSQEEFLYTFNELHQAGKPVILSADKLPNRFPNFMEDLVNQFRGGLIIPIDKPDLDLKMKIIHSRLKGSNLELDEEKIRYIAMKGGNDIRDILSIINSLTAEAMFNGSRNISKAVIDKKYAQVLSQHAENVSFDTVFRITTGHFNISPDRVISTRRDRFTVMVRGLIMYLARKHTDLSAIQIARKLGRKDHSTVHRAVKKMQWTIKTDPTIKTIVESLVKKIHQNPS